MRSKLNHIVKRVLSFIGLYSFFAYCYFCWKGKRLGFVIKRRPVLSCPKVEVSKGSRTILCAWKHISYLLDVLDGFDDLFEAVQYGELDGRFVVDYSEPKFHVTLPSREKFYFTGLPELEWISRLYAQETQMKPGEVVLDIGAYCGGSTIVFSQLVGDRGEVHAFEPDGANFEALSINVERLRKSNIVIYHKGVWIIRGKIKFQAEGNMGSSVAGILARRSRHQSIEVVTLEDALDNCRGKKAHVIKMDIEGAELPVLQSAREILVSTLPRLIIEAHVVRGQENTRDLYAFLEACGYVCKIVPQGKMSLPLVAAKPKATF
jgi:FkbM family methyltransferase